MAIFCSACGIQLPTEREGLGFTECTRCAPQGKLKVSHLGYKYEVEPEPPSLEELTKPKRTNGPHRFKVWTGDGPKETFDTLKAAWEYAETLDRPRIYGTGIGMIWPRSDRVGSTHTRKDWCVHPKNPRGNVIHCKSRSAKKLC